MRDYQPTKSNPYRLPPSLYRRALGLVRDYPRLLAQREERAPRGAVADTAARDIETVERALGEVPEEYREGVLLNVLTGVRRDNLDAAPSTWSRWRGRFLFFAARYSGWI